MKKKRVLPKDFKKMPVDELQQMVEKTIAEYEKWRKENVSD